MTGCSAIFASVAEETATSATGTARGTVTRVEPTKAQRAAARRVAESKATAPHLYLEAEVRTEAADLAAVVLACALALREFPRVNGAYRDGAFETYSRVNVGVSIPGSDAQVAPTIFDAADKELVAIRAELDDLAERAAAGALASPALAGGTFTVAGVAAAGSIRSYAPIINQGQAACLAVGPVTERPVVREGVVAAGRGLNAMLACDARIVGAEEGAGFLDRVRSLLEAPASLEPA